MFLVGVISSTKPEPVRCHAKPVYSRRPASRRHVEPKLDFWVMPPKEVPLRAGGTAPVDRLGPNPGICFGFGDFVMILLDWNK